VRAYADTSWWLAYKCNQDIHYPDAIELFEAEPDLKVVWTPWQRVEVFNALRQAERIGTLLQGESDQIIRLLEQEVRLGYWPHVEFDWTEAIRTANKLSSQHSSEIGIRGMDLFHVALSIEVGADILLSFDRQQNRLARGAGLKVIS
jgi:predicted nucleic acid-binding protein